MPRRWSLSWRDDRDSTDLEIRRTVFEWLTRHRDESGSEIFTRDELLYWQFRGQRLPLVGPQGIWKPAQCELPLSISTIVGGRYEDSVDPVTNQLTYAYRGTDPNHRDIAEGVPPSGGI